MHWTDSTLFGTFKVASCAFPENLYPALSFCLEALLPTSDFNEGLPCCWLADMSVASSFQVEQSCGAEPHFATLCILKKKERRLLSVEGS